MSLTRLAVILALLLLLAAGACMPAWPDAGGWRAWTEQVLALIAGEPVPAAILFFLVHTLFSVFALPGGAVMLLLAGAAWGVAAGSLLCLVSCTLGATLAMLLARHGLQPALARRWGRHLAAVEQGLRRDGIHYLFALRMFPVLPFVVVNLAFGFTAMRTWTFAWVSAAGMAIGTVAYVAAGAALGDAHRGGELFSPGLVVALAVLGLLPLAARRFTARRAGIPS